MEYTIENTYDVKRFISEVWKDQGLIFFKDFTVKIKKIERQINKLALKTEALKCYLFDDAGNILASSEENPINKWIEKKIVMIFQGLLKFSETDKGSIDFYDKIEIVACRDLQMLLKSIINGFVFVAIFPRKSELSEILPEYKKVLRRLHKCLKVRKGLFR